MAETQWNPWVDLADEWPGPRRRRGRRYEWATLLVPYSDEQLAVHPTRPTAVLKEFERARSIPHG